MQVGTHLRGVLLEMHLRGVQDISERRPCNGLCQVRVARFVYFVVFGFGLDGFCGLAGAGRDVPPEPAPAAGLFGFGEGFHWALEVFPLGFIAGIFFRGEPAIRERTP